MTATLPALAFAGIGLMGLPMTRRLLAAGYPLTLWNRTPDKCASLLEQGAHRVENPAELCRDANVVMLCLANTEVV
ncbi:MAG: NAD(P)-binding domain-containing protein, partial [Pseudomonas sp.]|nr:NAD(P)-binding domain-containing protein [Pseudomonas sp.]